LGSGGTVRNARTDKAATLQEDLDLSCLDFIKSAPFLFSPINFKKMPETPRKLSTLCLVGRLEALSFLILMGIAMPLKYVANKPQLVHWTGWIHGILFIVYIALVLNAWQRHHWPIVRPFLLGVASLLPFGPFLIERHLIRWEGDHPTRAKAP
jgi:integral membrane protein